MKLLLTLDITVRVSLVFSHTYRPVSEDLYEKVIVRDPALELYHGVFATFPSLQECPMQDLCSKHPPKQEKHLAVPLARGRHYHLLYGREVEPSKIEGGLNRFQLCLLVEVQRVELLDVVWPSVQVANKESPSHGRIHHDMIVFTSADRPMLRAGKDTVQRQIALDLYVKGARQRPTRISGIHVP